MPTKAHIPILIAGALLSTACARGEHLGGTRRPTPVGTDVTRPTVARPLGIDGREVGARLDTRLVVQPNFREILSFPADVTLAATYRFTLKRGDEIEVDIDAAAGLEPLIADVFEVIDSAVYRQVFRAAQGKTRFTYRADRGGQHVLRLQPPAGVSGQYAVRVEGPELPSLGYPVAGMTPSAIRSLFGEARDGGARDHKGVDIFAPRGTPVIAVSPGTITSVETTPVGGRIVWQRDDQRGLMYYYAHLEEHRAVRGQIVQPGDTIGTVGNSGNAKGSSTHLHFGVFRPGYEAEDPARYLLSNNGSFNATGGPPGTDASAPPSQLGSRIRLPNDRVRMRASPNEAAPVLEQLRAGTDLVVLGYLNGWTRVVLDDGRAGFVAGWLISGSTASAQH